MKTIVMILCLVVMGCGIQVNVDDWKKCEKICKPNGGISHFYNGKNSLQYYYNGLWIYMKNYKGE